MDEPRAKEEVSRSEREKKWGTQRKKEPNKWEAGQEKGGTPTIKEKRKKEKNKEYPKKTKCPRKKLEGQI